MPFVSATVLDSKHKCAYSERTFKPTEDQVSYEPEAMLATIRQAFLAMREVLTEVEDDPRRQRYSADSYLPEHLRAQLRAAMAKCGAVVK